ncbi:hypothetical protein RR46_14999 [Papilio xuthus]|uniref:Uncharacterized protein n=1 Tax=Papilio xuthus TaxID=66420 RepID=A0A194PK72_PAPXU|nr:hypothetical protein RR46_14999 [Papilio xuthus]
MIQGQNASNVFERIVAARFYFIIDVATQQWWRTLKENIIAGTRADRAGRLRGGRGARRGGAPRCSSALAIRIAPMALLLHAT